MQKSIAIPSRSRNPEERRPYEVHFYHYVWMFLICSFVGLVGEVIVSFAIDGRWESRAGFVIGPFSPIYGCGAVLATMFVNPIRDKSYVVQFAVAALLGGLFEYFAGWFFESRFGIVAWSYADVPLNFHGHTCVAISCVWGLLGIAWVAWGLGPMLRVVDRIPESVRNRLTNAAFCFIVLDALLTLGALDCWFLRVAGMQDGSAYQQFFATWFDDAFMSRRFETMSMWPVLASR